LKTGIYFSLIDWSHPDYPASGKIPPGTKSLMTRYAGTVSGNFFMARSTRSQSGIIPTCTGSTAIGNTLHLKWQSDLIRKRILADNPNAIINSVFAKDMETTPLPNNTCLCNAQPLRSGSFA
jgi:hypothetical protein